MSNALENITEPISSALNDRMKSKLFSTFAGAWCLSNWKIFYVTVFVGSDDLHTNKLDYISSHFLYFPDNWLTLLFVPVLATTLWFTGWKWLDRKVFENDSKNEMLKRKIREGFDSMTVLAEKEASIQVLQENVKKHEDSLNSLHIWYATYTTGGQYFDVTGNVRLRVSTAREAIVTINGNTFGVNSSQPEGALFLILSMYGQLYCEVLPWNTSFRIQRNTLEAHKAGIWETCKPYNKLLS